MNLDQVLNELQNRIKSGVQTFTESRKKIVDTLKDLTQTNSAEIKEEADKKMDELEKLKGLKQIASFEEFRNILEPLNAGTKIKILTAKGKEVIFTKPKQEGVPGIFRQTGLYLSPPHGELIWKGLKKAIVKSIKLREHTNEPLYLLSDSKVYGIISISLPSKISIKQFKNLYSRHLISELERKRWWPDKKELYYYKVKIIRLYKPPKFWKKPVGPQVFVKNVKFEDSLEFKEKIDSTQDEPTRAETVTQEMKQHGNWYLVKQPKGKKFKYVAQYHRRGNSVHIDLRIEANDHLVGWTLNQPSLPEGFKGTQRDLMFSKHDKFLNPVDPSKQKDYQILCEQKLIQPKVWLTVKGKIPPGGIGATKYKEAEFTIISRGTANFGTCKTDFVEYWLDPESDFKQEKTIKGRWIIAWIPRPAHYIKAGEGKMMWGMWKPNEQRAYIDYHDFEKEKDKALKEKIDMIWQGFNGQEFVIVTGKNNLPKNLKA